MEHVRNWRTVISNLKNLCTPGGIIPVTTCMPGHYYHPHPDDFWRYTPEDFKELFSDCTIESIESDPRTVGVYIRARKPKQFNERDLLRYELTSIIAGKRIIDINDMMLAHFKKRYARRLRLRRTLNAFLRFFASFARRIIPGV